MKNLLISAVTALALTGCGYQKDGASWGQAYDDYMECSKEAAKQQSALEKQCMQKQGYHLK